MRRFAATLAYDGSAYFGFQRQPDPTLTIQRAVEGAIEKVARQQVSIIAAGRTDTGVHALGQVIAFDLVWRHSDGDLLRAINAELSLDVALQKLWQQDGFHPRYDALWRQYTYKVSTPAVRNPLIKGRVWQLVDQTLDANVLKSVAELCRGQRDFAAFGTPPQAGSTNTVREVFESRWKLESGPYGRWYTYTVRANAFLYHMVRRMVGTMIQAAVGRIDLNEFQEILDSRDIQQAKVMAPAEGLFLETVGYPPRQIEALGSRKPSAVTAGAKLE